MHAFAPENFASLSLLQASINVFEQFVVKICLIFVGKIFT